MLAAALVLQIPSTDAAERPVPTLYPQQAVAAVVLAGLILLVVFELVRKRKLREEYSLLWVATAIGLLLLAWQPRLLGWFAWAIDAREASSALFFGGLLFLMLISLQFSVRLSKLTFRNRKLGQRVALLERELHELKGRTGTSSVPDDPARTESDSRTPSEP